MIILGKSFQSMEIFDNFMANYFNCLKQRKLTILNVNSLYGLTIISVGVICLADNNETTHATKIHSPVRKTIMWSDHASFMQQQ